MGLSRKELQAEASPCLRHVTTDSVTGVRQRHPFIRTGGRDTIQHIAVQRRQRPVLPIRSRRKEHDAVFIG